MSTQNIILPTDNATDKDVLKYLDKYEKDHTRYVSKPLEIQKIFKISQLNDITVS